MPEGNLKTPSPIFKWFEKMKSGYEKNILAVLQRFEQNNNQQQIRIDKAHNEFINMMQENHLSQVSQYNAQIAQQHKEISYFKQQIAQQQQTISQLNNRYDTVVIELIANQQQKTPLKDIFDEDNVISTDTSVSEHSPISATTAHRAENISTLNIEQTKQESNHRKAKDEKVCEEIYLKALAMRNAHNNQQAFITFKKAAYLGHVLAMGAMGRAYFLAEGVTKDPETGLAWLINAANLHLPQALSRVEFFKVNEPTLYQDASVIAKNIKQDIINTENSAHL